MKKRIVLSTIVALTAAFGSAKVSGHAHASSSVKIINVSQADTGTVIKVTNLPQAIKVSLAGDTYKGWTISSASLVKTSADAYYRITLKSGENTKIVTMDKDGKVIE